MSERLFWGLLNSPNTGLVVPRHAHSQHRLNLKSAIRLNDLLYHLCDGLGVGPRGCPSQHFFFTFAFDLFSLRIKEETY